MFSGLVTVYSMPARTTNHLLCVRVSFVCRVMYHVLRLAYAYCCTCSRRLFQQMMSVVDTKIMWCYCLLLQVYWLQRAESSFLISALLCCCHVGMPWLSRLLYYDIFMRC